MFRYFLLCDTKITSFVTRNQNARTRIQSVSRNTSQPNVSTTDIWGVGTVFLTPCIDSIGDFTPALCYYTTYGTIQIFENINSRSCGD